MISAFDKEEMRRFAEWITPKSWNIILDQKDALESRVFAGCPLVHWILPTGSRSDIFIKPIIQWMSKIS